VLNVLTDSTEEERIPYAEGFVKGNHSLADVVAMISAVEAVET